MSDFESLKTRIEQAERRLAQARQSRTQETAKLSDMWQQIRDRYRAQGDELRGLRGRVSELETANDSLISLVERLLTSIDGYAAGSVEGMSREMTVMARDLLDGAPGLESIGIAPSRANQSPISQSAEEFVALDDAPALHSGVEFADPAPREPSSADPGISELVARIENSFGARSAASAEAGEHQTVEDAALAHELSEIKKIQDEVIGLRQRISGRSDPGKAAERQ